MIIISVVLGYLIGSILPAYYLGRLKGIDIRNEGAEYAGTINIYHVLGIQYAIMTGIFDLFKGIFAIRLAESLGANFAEAQWAGIAAIAGHVLPFYIGFRGGQGVACATGIMLYYLLHFLELGAVPLKNLLFLAIIVLIFGYIARQGELISQIVLPLIALTCYCNVPSDNHNSFLGIVILYIMAVGIYNIKTRKLIKLEGEDFSRFRWRILLRPFAILFIFLYLLYGKESTLILILILLAASLILDIDRLIGKNWLTAKLLGNFSYNKAKERKKISSITTFLFSCLAVLAVLPREIAFISILLLIFGDMFAKIFGVAFKRNEFLHKSLEGTLAFFGCGLIIAYVLNLFFSYNVILIMIGTVVAALAEAAFEKIDDNLAIPFLSGIAMWAATLAGIQPIIV